MFNLFRQKGEPTILCALRDGAALPGFLHEGGWQFEGKVEAVDGVLHELDAQAAEAVIDTTGYYIFTRH